MVKELSTSQGQQQEEEEEQQQQQQRQQRQQTSIPNWHLKIDYVETCNCDHGCPCNSSGFLVQRMHSD